VNHEPARVPELSRDRKGAEPSRSPELSRDRKGAEPSGDCQAAERTCPRKEAEKPIPPAYLITFTTYGTWLHGDPRGSVDREHSIWNTAFLDPDRARQAAENRRLCHPPVRLDAQGRTAVERTILEVCAHRDWTVHALNVRTNHVHLVVSAPQSPGQVMNCVKSWTTRRLREAGLISPTGKVWTRHGSTRYLWRPPEVARACRYVTDGQGPDLPGNGAGATAPLRSRL